MLIHVMLYACTGDSAKKTETAAETPAEIPAQTEPEYTGPAGIPSFMMTDLNGKPINSSELTGNITLILFNPDCDHCQREAQSINASKNLFLNKQIWFVSVDEPEFIAKFRTDYGLTDSNFHFARTDVELIVRALGPVSSVPAMFFYKNGKLTAQMEGEKSAKDIASKM